jgi:hypothetical protein
MAAEPAVNHLDRRDGKRRQVRHRQLATPLAIRPTTALLAAAAQGSCRPDLGRHSPQPPSESTGIITATGQGWNAGGLDGPVYRPDHRTPRAAPDAERAMSVEAVQFREFGQWHAVPDGQDRTLCGRDATKAERMYVDWNGVFESECCRVCLRAIAANEDQP